MKEIWKDIEGYEGLYEVSTHARIRSYKNYGHGKKDTYRILKPQKRGNYVAVTLYKSHIPDTRSVHRLVAETFIPNPENKPCINHLDGNKLNSCVWNLEWSTYSENLEHAYAIGLVNREGERGGNAKLKEEYVLDIRNAYELGCFSQRELAKAFECSQTNIGRILRRESWSNV